MQRRNLLLGLGGAAAGSALLGSGAVSELTAERSINVSVAEDSQGLIALESTGSTYSNEYFDGTSSTSAVIDLGNPDNGLSNPTGINYDSEAYFDDLFAIKNRSASATDVTLPVNSAGNGDSDGAFENDDDLNVELYQGNRSTGSFQLISDVSPLTLQTGESKNVGIRVRVPPKSDDSLEDKAQQSLSGDLQLTAESRVTLSENIGNDAAISYRGGTPVRPKIASEGKPDELDLGFTFDTVNDEEATFVFVEFNGDALVPKDGGNVADYMDGDSINVGNSLDVSSVSLVNRGDDDGDSATATTGPNGETTADFAVIKIEMQDPIVSQSDSRDTALNSFLVQLEDQTGPSAEVNVRLETASTRSSGSKIAETGFVSLNN